jgi:hypothetical protein
VGVGEWVRDGVLGVVLLCLISVWGCYANFVFGVMRIEYNEKVLGSLTVLGYGLFYLSRFNVVDGVYVLIGFHVKK